MTLQTTPARPVRKPSIRVDRVRCDFLIEDDDGEMRQPSTYVVSDDAGRILGMQISFEVPSMGEIAELAAGGSSSHAGTSGGQRHRKVRARTHEIAVGQSLARKVKP